MISLINHFKLFLEHFRYSVFQENNHRKSIHANTEMKNIQTYVEYCITDFFSNLYQTR